MLCSDPRKLVCAFQDAWWMLEAAACALAPSNPDGVNQHPGHGKKGRRKAAKELGKVGKRLGYFFLWARSHGEEVAPAIIKAMKRAG